MNAANDQLSAFHRFYNFVLTEARPVTGELVLEVAVPREIQSFPDQDIRQGMINLVAKAHSPKSAEPVDYFNKDFSCPAGVSVDNAVDRTNPEHPVIRITLTGAAKFWFDELNRDRDKETDPQARYIETSGRNGR